MRVAAKLRGNKVDDFLNKLHVAVPARRDTRVCNCLRVVFYVQFVVICKWFYIYSVVIVSCLCQMLLVLFYFYCLYLLFFKLYDRY